jgi:hypothetical protein
MAKNFEKLIFGGLHEKHPVQRGIWVPTQHSLWDQGKPRKTLIELYMLSVIWPRHGPQRKRRLQHLPHCCLLHSHYLAMAVSLASHFLLDYKCHSIIYRILGIPINR